MKRDSQNKTTTPVFPFTAIVGQEQMKLALLLNVINPETGGVLIMGHRGTAKSTAVRSLSDLLPPRSVSPLKVEMNINEAHKSLELRSSPTGDHNMTRIPMVTLPLSATEDRVVGTLDIEAALSQGKKSFEPGLLARAHGGFLYIDEVNLLDDHLVDLLLDVAASGINIVEREGLSVRHPSKFVLVGSGNPEEGDLRPQLLDRFGLYTRVSTITDVKERMKVVKLTETFKKCPHDFLEKFAPKQQALRDKVINAMDNLKEVVLPERLMAKAVELCLQLKIDGHRGEITISRAARALAALRGRKKVIPADIREVAPMCLQHRLRRDPLEQIDSGEKIKKALVGLFAGD